MSDRSDWDDDLEDEPLDDDDDSDTVSCRACGRSVYEDAEQCPYCGEYLTADTSAWSGRPLWWIALGLLGVLAVIAALTRW